jgi:4-cresol dehydrogenase (hydroxylating)
MSVVTSTFESAVAAAVRDLRSALGHERVLTEPEELSAFRDPFQHSASDEFTASAVVMPEAVEGIQDVVRIAGKYGVPLWTHSTGRNNGYGGPAPRVKGSVIVSLTT